MGYVLRFFLFVLVTVTAVISFVMYVYVCMYSIYIHMNAAAADVDVVWLVGTVPLDSAESDLRCSQGELASIQDLQFACRRAVSRLMEMSGSQYLQTWRKKYGIDYP